MSTETTDPAGFVAGDFDSRPDTLEHIRQVRIFMRRGLDLIDRRAAHHDASKLQEPEKSAFDRQGAALAGLTYGTPEYFDHLKKVDLKPAIEHHWAHNSHHPEFYPNGIAGMSLLDIYEMVCDWKAASLRVKDGDFLDSLNKNRMRFGIGPQLFAVIVNFAREMGFVAPDWQPAAPAEASDGDS